MYRHGRVPGWSWTGRFAGNFRWTWLYMCMAMHVHARAQTYLAPRLLDSDITLMSYSSHGTVSIASTWRPRAPRRRGGVEDGHADELARAAMVRPRHHRL